MHSNRALARSFVRVRRLAALLGFLVVSPSCAEGELDPFEEQSDLEVADGGTRCSRDAHEICNGRDDNCDGRVDEGFDVDGDGVPTCVVSGKPADCDDKDRRAYPGAPELCNGRDDNCDGAIDEDFDRDSDGFFACPQDGKKTDCDDGDRMIHPGAVEICNRQDDDCDGVVDDVAAKLRGSLVPPFDPHWKNMGSAILSDGWAQLTGDSTGQSGALWWDAPYTFDAFDMSATFWIQSKANGADGLSFAWLEGRDLAVGQGSAYGVGGLSGYAVAIDTYQNSGEPSAPHLVIAEAANAWSPLGRYSIPNVRDGAEHRLRVTLATGKVSVWIDGVNYVSNYALPNTAPLSGHWGFTAGTGALSESHWITDITMSFPNGQGCVE